MNTTNGIATIEPVAQDEMVAVAKIELMYTADANKRLWKTEGGYIIDFKELGPHMVGLFEDDGIGEGNHYKVTTFMMERSKFEKLDDFGGW